PRVLDARLPGPGPRRGVRPGPGARHWSGRAEGAGGLNRPSRVFSAARDGPGGDPFRGGRGWGADRRDRHIAQPHRRDERGPRAVPRDGGPGRVAGGSAADAAEMKRASAALRWWRSLRAEHEWKADIMVETHDSLLTASAIRRFARAAPGAAILWDSHHTWRKGGEDPAATWRAVGR